MKKELTAVEKAEAYDRMKAKQKAHHAKRNAMRNAKVKAWDAAVAAGKVEALKV